MADSNPPTTPVSEPETQQQQQQHQHQHWCYNCDKRVSVEILNNVPDNIVCFECKNGFVESISSTSEEEEAVVPPSMPSDHGDDDDIEDFGRRFFRAIRLLAHEARVLDSQRDRQPALTEEGQRLHGLADDDEEEEEEQEEGERNDEGVEDFNGDIPEIDEDELRRRRRRDGLRLLFGNQLGDVPRTGRDRILDWAEILLHFEDESIRLDFPDSNRYIGNPGDYVDGAEFEALLQNLAESDSGGRRGAPPASKEVVAGLLKEKVELEEQVVLCAVCKDSVGVGEMLTKLPCGHGYHGDCIVPWLGARNNCPVCRFELPTDDQEYEEEKRKKRLFASGGWNGSGSSSSN